MTVASDAVAHIHRDLANAALPMRETDMGALILPAARALN